MKAKKFYTTQKDSTAIKLLFYGDYIEKYLITLLMQFGKCIICDFFCGPGMNGGKKGSPLILIDIANKVLENKILQKHVRNKYGRNPKIIILFNDENKSYIDSLDKTLKGTIVHPDIERHIENKNFSTIMNSKIIKIFEKSKIPKFIFLDPFIYSIIKMRELKKIMQLPFTEVLFFCPTCKIWRFGMVDNKEIKNFIKEFTSTALIDCKNFMEFIESICIRLRKEIHTDFVRPIPIVTIGSKNTLFFITRNPVGMCKINKFFLQNTFNGEYISVKDFKRKKQRPTLFKKDKIEFPEFKNVINRYKKKLLNDLKKDRKMLNTEIICHSISNYLLPKYAKNFITKLKKEGKIDYQYLTKDKRLGPYISEKNWKNKLCEIILK